MERRINKLIVLIISVFIASVSLAAQDSQVVIKLRQEIENSSDIRLIEKGLKELSDIYIKDNKFDEFYNFLETLEKNKQFKSVPMLYYYKVLARSSQLRFLEDGKMWEELFEKKDSYVSSIEADLAKANKLVTSKDGLSLNLKFLEWQLKKDNEKESINILEDLFNLASVYSKAQGDAAVIKNIADLLSKEKETNYAKKLYYVYVSKIAQSDIGLDELKNIADGFLSEDRINLAASLFDAYLDKVINSQTDKSIAALEMLKIAEKFAHSGWKDGPDPFYAEKIYEKIDSLNQKGAFSEQEQYRRAYNLEKSKEYKSCLAEYLKLINDFPNYGDNDRIYFRIGVITAYISNEPDKAREYFLKVVNNYPSSVDYLNSLYHLGLLSHWQNDLEKAKECYGKILDKTKDIEVKPEIAVLANERKKEIEEAREIQYNLRVFLKSALTDKNIQEKAPVHLELYARSAKDYIDMPVRFEANSYSLDTGCLQQNFTYLWSGQLGNNQNPLNEYEFETNYDDLGTKVVNVVLVGPSGIVSGTTEMADIYQGTKN
jgi:TolA-binding protein